jgi:preprotein translocase subunit SecE
MASEDGKNEPGTRVDEPGAGSLEGLPPEEQAALALSGEGEGEGEYEGTPTQLGNKRFVYAAYFAGAIAVAFFFSKAGHFAWAKLSSWKPTFGEPQDEIVMPIAAVIGALVALYYWRREDTRNLAEEVASELGKVTWPNRREVTNNTFIVIVTTLFATVFFALMDRFWAFVTNLVYGT